MARPDTLVVFTARSPARIIEEGGSQAWKLDPTKAKQCDWLVCTQNRRHPDHEFSDATEPHGAGFLIGRISAVVRSTEPDGDRWKVEIGEYAEIDVRDLWDGSRNPIRYTTLERLGIEPNGLDFQDMPSRHGASVSSPAAMTELSGLTIEEAKRGLAKTFGVGPDAVEITIRG